MAGDEDNSTELVEMRSWTARSGAKARLLELRNGDHSRGKYRISVPITRKTAGLGDAPPEETTVQADVTDIPEKYAEETLQALARALGYKLEPL